MQKLSANRHFLPRATRTENIYSILKADLVFFGFLGYVCGGKGRCGFGETDNRSIGAKKGPGRERQQSGIWSFGCLVWPPTLVLVGATGHA